MKSTKLNILALMLMFCLANVSAHATAFDADFYGSNDIMFYDETSSVCGGSSESDGAGVDGGDGSISGDFSKPKNITLKGANNAEKVMNYLLDQGFSVAAASGLMGNFAVESEFRPAVANYEGSGAFGLAQWLGPRLETLKKYGGSKYDTLEVQVQFIFYELQTTEKSSVGVKNQTTPRGAAAFWHKEYERAPGQGDEKRMSAAQRIHDQWERSKTIPDTFIGQGDGSDGGGGGGGGDDSEACASNFNGGDLIDIIKAYAWPDYHKAPYPKRKPAYAEAVKKAQSDGRYVGGNTMDQPGVDCGGFITTLMVDSGFEPKYNYGGKLDKGAGNTVNQKKWLDKNWKKIGTGSSINSADLKPGDVAMEDGHTFMWAGKIDGFNSEVASASIGLRTGGRAPMAGMESPTKATLTWYRKK